MKSCSYIWRLIILGIWSQWFGALSAQYYRPSSSFPYLQEGKTTLMVYNDTDLSQSNSLGAGIAIRPHTNLGGGYSISTYHNSITHSGYLQYYKELSTNYLFIAMANADFSNYNDVNKDTNIGNKIKRKELGFNVGIKKKITNEFSFMLYNGVMVNDFISLESFRNSAMDTLLEIGLSDFINNDPRVFYKIGGQFLVSQKKMTFYIGFDRIFTRSKSPYLINRVMDIGIFVPFTFNFHKSENQGVQ